METIRDPPPVLRNGQEGALRHLAEPARGLKDGETDYFREADDMELNRWSERRVFYKLTGAAPDMQSIRRVAKRCLDQGKACAMPVSIANLHRG